MNEFVIIIIMNEFIILKSQCWQLHKKVPYRDFSGYSVNRWNFTEINLTEYFVREIYGTEIYGK